MNEESVVIKNKSLYDATIGKLPGVFRPDIMVDRIVNVKLNYTYFDNISGNQLPMQSIVIRSDYEMQGSPATSGLFVSSNVQQTKILGSVTETNKPPVLTKVRIKPDIRIKYRGYGNTGIEFDLVIGNFFALVQDFAKELNSTTAGIKIQSVEILFGYMSQFPDIRILKGSLGTEAYYNFASSLYSYASYLKGDVLYWYRSAAPPDGEYTFACAVASTRMPAERLMGDVVRNFVFPDAVQKAMYDSYTYHVESHGFSLMSVIEWYITKHYVRHSENAKEPYLYTFAMELMPVHANMFGVQVFVMSPKIFKAKSKDFLDCMLPLAPTAIGMLNTIKEMLYPDLDYRYGIDGNIYVYDTTEHWSDPVFVQEYNKLKPALDGYNEQIKKRSAAASDILRLDGRPVKNRTLLPVTVPAVYDIQYGPITTISMPFFGLFNVGQEILFNVAYAVANNQAAAIDTRVPDGNVVYTVLYYDIDFGTAEEYNKVVIYCIAAV